uniref:Uncharacterized protein n=1 Tax=Cacopsylla melanoneura TaxID=428564 RepID=A0A8D8YE22_9HEMI
MPNTFSRLGFFFSPTLYPFCCSVKQADRDRLYSWTWFILFPFTSIWPIFLLPKIFVFSELIFSPNLLLSLSSCSNISFSSFSLFAISTTSSANLRLFSFLVPIFIP